MTGGHLDLSVIMCLCLALLVHRGRSAVVDLGDNDLDYFAIVVIGVLSGGRYRDVYVWRTSGVRTHKEPLFSILRNIVGGGTAVQR